MSSGVGSDTAEPELTGGALAFAIIMGVAITVCITVSCWTCYKKREQARLDLEEDSNAAIEAYYGEASVTSIGSPPPNLQSAGTISPNRNMTTSPGTS